MTEEAAPVSPVGMTETNFTLGVTRPKLTLKDFRTLRLLLPPLPEQRRIADILDKADAVRRKRKETRGGKPSRGQLEMFTEAVAE
jgi:Type I restriction modification DNA specificity domain